MKSIRKYLILVALPIFIFSCKTDREAPEEEGHFVEITAEQFKTNGIQIAEVEKRAFERRFSCSGAIVHLPEGMAIVSSHVPGIVAKIFCYNGKQVNKGEPLFEISGNALVDLQKEFAESASKQKRLKSEFDRYKTLYAEKVITEKEFIAAETEYRSTEALYQSLKLKITAIGLPVAGIERGDFYGSFTIHAPIRGVVTNLKLNHGSYVDIASELVQIVNPDMIQLQLSVFPKDIQSIARGQQVIFRMPGSSFLHTAAISGIGAALNHETKTVDCYAMIAKNETAGLVANQFVECEVITGTDTVHAISSEGILKTESGYAILKFNRQEADRYFFERTEVIPGREQAGFTEISKTELKGKFAVKGVYNLHL
jgi:cobalt-zinc-cadmium efflux system membrane fusion protein